MCKELEVPRSTVALVPSLLFGMIEGAGPLACIMVNKFVSAIMFEFGADYLKPLLVYVNT